MVAKHLLSNPAFTNNTHFRSEKIYTEKAGRREVWNTVWWWEVLVSNQSVDFCRDSFVAYTLH